MKKAPLRCRICNVVHARKPLDVDVTYCPTCGVPHFFPAGTFPLDGRRLDLLACIHCGRKFDPSQGGGVTVQHPSNYGEAFKVETPRGLLQNRRLI